MSEEDRENHFREALDRLRSQVEHYLSVAEDDSVHWEDRLEAANDARDRYQEWREVRQQSKDEGYRLRVRRPSEPRFGLVEEILGDRKGTLGVSHEWLPPHVACQHGKALEDKRTELLQEGLESRAEEALEEAKEVYWTLIEAGFEGTFPYKRLCVIYRSRDRNPIKEEEVAKEALSFHVDRTENQTEWFEDRVQCAQELRQKEVQEEVE